MEKTMKRFQIGRFALVLAVVAGPVIYLFLHFGQPSTALERALLDIGFYPIRPPSTLVAPGSIYHVSADGKFYTLVCKADEQDTRSVMERSSSEEMVARELQDVKYTLDFDSAELVKAKLKSDMIESVNYSLRDVSVLEIPLEKNAEIFARLTGRKSCRDVVDRLLENRELVCQGQSVLIATVQYQLVMKGSSENSAELAKNVPAVKEALETALETRIAFDNGRFVSGTALHYGVKVNPLCATRREDTEPRHLPRNQLDRFATFVRFNLGGA